MKRIVPIVITLILAIAGYYYFKLGGSTDLSFQVIEKKSMMIKGKYYEGVYNSSQIESLFVEMRDLSVQYGLPLVVVNEGSDEEAREVSQWIGILLNGDSLVSKREDLHSRVFENIKVISTCINAHNAVMPQPGDVRKEAERFSLSKGLKLEDISIEIYYGEDSLGVIFPVKAY